MKKAESDQIHLRFKRLYGCVRKRSVSQKKFQAMNIGIMVIIMEIVDEAAR